MLHTHRIRLWSGLVARTPAHGLQAPLTAPAELSPDFVCCSHPEASLKQFAARPQVTQRWTVPAAAGPGALDLSTVAHSYGSTVNPINDFYSGLFGLSMIAAKGALLPSGLVCAESPGL